MTKRLPLLESFAAVFAVATVAFMTALPAIQDSGERNVDLQDNLSLIRTAVFRFTMDHEVDGAKVNPAFNGEDFEAQILGRTRSDGSTHQRGRFEDRFFGPYLNAIPMNPVNDLNTIRVMPKGVTEPILNGTAGWVYVSDTGEIFADLAGVDARGDAYSEY
ncbi:MAG: hypothetical protein QGF46_01100 [Planctomycetota bacterium]|nr:hypothetical protein [Planctomycetota bacterium]